jgi:hypothetical protein
MDFILEVRTLISTPLGAFLAFIMVMMNCILFGGLRQSKSFIGSQGRISAGAGYRVSDGKREFWSPGKGPNGKFARPPSGFFRLILVNILIGIILYVLQVKVGLAINLICFVYLGLVALSCIFSYCVSAHWNP